MRSSFHARRRSFAVVLAALAALFFLSALTAPAFATTSQNGVTYGANPYYQPPNASQVAVKTNQLALISPAVNQLLNAGQNQPVPSVGTVSQSDGACSGGCGRCSVSCNPPSALKNSVSGQRQQYANWCVPANTATMFTTWSMAGITQTTIASEEHTGVNGTNLGNVPPSLNSRQNYNYYWYETGISDGASILQKVTLNVWNNGSDVMLPGQGKWLPWWYQSGYEGYHSWTLYGYYTQGGGGFYTWDPANYTWAGFHTLNKEDAYYIDRDGALSNNSTPDLVW